MILVLFIYLLHQIISKFANAKELRKIKFKVY